MGKKISDNGVNLIASFEGCRLVAYMCMGGVWTIGYGHTNGVKKGMEITKEQAKAYLKEDCEKFEKFVNNSNYVPVTEQLNQNQFDALVSFAYNCGQGNLKKLCAGRTIEQIAENIPNYNKSNGRVLLGLQRRRSKEVELFNSTEGLETKSLDEIAKEVVAGKWGVGDERKRLLTQSGYDYDAVQLKVNELCKK